MAGLEELAGLIERAQQHDVAAFDRLVELYSPRLYGFMYRLIGDTHEAEDLVQEVFVRVVRTIGRYQEDGRFEAWLFRIAVNLARDYGRRAKRSIDALSLEHAEEDDQSIAARVTRTAIEAADDPLRQADRATRVQEALARLSAPERETILLRHYADMSFAEIAEAMGTPLGTALARAHRALGKLREWLTDVNEDDTR